MNVGSLIANVGLVFICLGAGVIITSFLSLSLRKKEGYYDGDAEKAVSNFETFIIFLVKVVVGLIFTLAGICFWVFQNLF